MQQHVHVHHVHVRVSNLIGNELAQTNSLRYNFHYNNNNNNNTHKVKQIITHYNNSKNTSTCTCTLLALLYTLIIVHIILPLFDKLIYFHHKQPFVQSSPILYTRPKRLVEI